MAKTLGGSADEFGLALYEANNTYIVSGFAHSQDGDVSNHHGLMDAWVIKLDTNGNIIWNNCFGGSGDDYFGSISGTGNSDIVLTGSTNSNDGDVTSTPAGRDVWTMRMDTSGAILWQATNGSSAIDFGSKVMMVNDSTYVVLGTVAAGDIDVTNARGGRDYWLFQLGSSITDVSDVNLLDDMAIYPTATTQMVHISCGALPVEVSLYNLEGKELQMHSVKGSFDLDLSGVAQGLYIVKATINGASKTWKVVRL